MTDKPDLEAPEVEYVVFTKQAYEDAITEMAGNMFHGGFMTRRALGDPMRLTHVGFFSKEYGFEGVKHGITGPDNNGDFAFTLTDPIPWREING